MSVLNSVQLAIDLATRRRDDAGQSLAQTQRIHRSALEQMEQLASYASDTESKWAISAQLRATPEVLQHYYLFMGRLQQAIDLQRVAVAGLLEEFTAATKFLLDAELRLACLKQTLHKKTLGIKRRQAGREQKQLDEIAAVQHRRLRAAIDTVETI